MIVRAGFASSGNDKELLSLLDEEVIGGHIVRDLVMIIKFEGKGRSTLSWATELSFESFPVSIPESMDAIFYICAATGATMAQNRDGFPNGEFCTLGNRMVRAHSFFTLQSKQVFPRFFYPRFLTLYMTRATVAPLSAK